MQPLVLLDTVALTSRHLRLAPRLHALAQAGWQRPLGEVVPAVTCTAQASLLTGKLPQEHGIVGNGWYWRETGEVRFWLQANALLQAEPLYQTLRRLPTLTSPGVPCRVAKLFWWFNQGAAVDISVTPKPHYGADGNKIFDIASTPAHLGVELQKKFGPFPFPTFWGPLAGLPCSEWIGCCAADVLVNQRPDLTLVYLPHLDYDTQRYGPQGCDWPRLLRELDQACAPILDAAKAIGAPVWVVNEYTHLPVRRVVEPNRLLRRAGLLEVRRGPFGETLDTFASRAVAVCDHQIAHVYVRFPEDVERVRELLAQQPGVGRVLAGPERAEVALDHPRAGNLVAFSTPDAWFAYPFWLDDRHAPDYARTVNIHAKPGYDPCELFFDPTLWWPKGRALWRLIQKKLGFRSLFDVVPLDATLVKGSHGLAVEQDQDRPVLIGAGPAPAEGVVPMTAVRDLLMRVMMGDR